MLIKNEGDFTVVIKDNNHQKKLIKARQESSMEYGKYLLFSNNRDALLEVTRKIVDHYGLSEFHISNKSNDSGSFSYVSKIYDDNNDLAVSIDHLISISEYRNAIKYRYFKPEWKTENGVYSNAYLKGKENNDIL